MEAFKKQMKLNLKQDFTKINTKNIQSPIYNKIKPQKGTTTLAFIFKEGIIIAVDSRATAGSYIASQTVNKVIEVNKYLLGTMAGCAADCFYWEKQMGVFAKLYELNRGKRISVSRASIFLSDSLYQYRGNGLSVGSIVCGWDEEPALFYVDDEGKRIKGNLFSVGSGSTIAYGILQSDFKFEMSKEEAVKLGKSAIYHAAHRDAYSGGSVNVYFMDQNGWEKIGSYDVSELYHEINKN